MSNTFSDITQRMKDRLESSASRMEGSWSADNIQAVANELARIYAQDIDPMLEKAFVSTATGDALTLACADYGIDRNPATYAETRLQITGEPGDYDAIQAVADDIVFLTTPFTIPDTGNVSMRAVCMISGSVGNVPAHSITKIIPVNQRIRSVTNPEAAAGGYDEEGDISLAERTLERIRKPSTSGNIADYKKWALEITGVEKVRIFPLARGAGTVDVVIIADNNTVAPDLLTNTVAAYIEEQRPIGADVQVIGAAAVEVILAAQIIALEGYGADEIARQLQQELVNYTAEIAFESRVVSYLKLADIIFGCSGVADIISYTLNGGQDSIELTDRQFPMAVMPTVVLT